VFLPSKEKIHILASEKYNVSPSKHFVESVEKLLEEGAVSLKAAPVLNAKPFNGNNRRYRQ